MIEHDPHGTPHPDYDPTQPRFAICFHSHDPDDETGWRRKLQLTDRKYRDSDGFPIDTIAAGDTWKQAFARAGEMIDLALSSDACVF